MSYTFVLSQSQRKMAEFCRSGQYDSEVAMPHNRAEVYRDLILSTVEQALIKAYPLTYQLLETSDWDRLVTEFFAFHPQPFPSFWKMPKGLCDFVREREWGIPLNLPYLSDLLQFEWIEIEVYMMPDCEKQEVTPYGDLMQDYLYVNPEHRFQTYRYPVFQPCPLSSDLPIGEHHLFCYRHPKSGQVHFISLSRFYKAVLERLIKGECTGKEAVDEVAQEMKLPINEHVYRTVRGFFQDLLSKEAVLGFIEGV